MEFFQSLQPTWGGPFPPQISCRKHLPFTVGAGGAIMVCRDRHVPGLSAVRVNFPALRAVVGAAVRERSPGQRPRRGLRAARIAVLH